MKTPPRVVISEVGTRDGLQIERDFVATADKIRIIDALSEAGIAKIEATGFAHPSVVPQLRDAEEVLMGIRRCTGTSYAAYVPNIKGAERAIRAKVDELKAGLTASETFNRLNVRMDTSTALKTFGDIADLGRAHGLPTVGVLGTAFGCPYEGNVLTERVLKLLGGMIEAGARLIYLADTTGMANPVRITAVMQEAIRRWPTISFGLHLHNTRGAGLANALAGLQAGVMHFESSVGGLGGCPYAPRAVGNICTEDFVHMIHEMRYETGVDLDALIAAARVCENIIGRTLPGMVMKAGKTSELHDPAAKNNG